MTTKFDFIYPIGYNFQDEATMTMSQLIGLHDDIMIIILFILFFIIGIVFWWIILVVHKFKNVLIVINIITTILIFFKKIKQTILKLLKIKGNKKKFSSFFLGFYFKKVGAINSINYMLYKVQIFCIKYKTLIIIISCVVAAAAIAYTAYSFYTLIAAYQASYAILISEAKEEMLLRYEMFSENKADYLLRHMPTTKFRVWLNDLNYKLVQDGEDTIIFRNITGIEHYQISDVVVKAFAEANEIPIKNAQSIIMDEIPRLNPMEYDVIGDMTKSALEKAKAFDQGFKEIQDIYKQHEEIEHAGKKIFRGSLVIVAVCITICVATVTMTYIDLPDVTPLLLIP